MDGFWPTLPDARQRFIAEMFAVVREVCVGNEERNGPIRYLSVRVMRSHDAVHISYEDRLDLECAKLAVTASGKVISVRFDLDERG